MTKDDIIRMAREAKMPYDFVTLVPMYITQLTTFAALVAAHEREECAEACDEMEASPALSAIEKYRTQFIAAAIRARGQA